MGWEMYGYTDSGYGRELRINATREEEEILWV